METTMEARMKKAMEDALTKPVKEITPEVERELKRAAFLSLKKRADESLRLAHERNIQRRREEREAIERHKAEMERLYQESIKIETRTVIDLDEAAKILGRAPSTVRTLAQRGKIPSFKAGKYRRFVKEELEAWMNKN